VQARLRFDRNEFAGAFGDIGTDLPLLVALIATCSLDAASVCIMFGLLQIATGIRYGIPMPVQPLKAMAAIMLAQRLSPATFAAGGIVIGAVMLVLTLSGLLDWLARVIPREVVRGIQLGLALTLSKLALGKYVPTEGVRGYALAAACALVLIALRKQNRIPAPLLVIGLGILYATLTHAVHAPPFSVHLPTLVIPSGSDFTQGALLLALPQIPLSLGNSVVATEQTARDLFPDRTIRVRTIGLTYALMNLIAPWFGGVPTCHGSNGLAGFHRFGARTGGAPIIYGGMYLLLGLCFSRGFAEVVRIFPLPVLGVILLFEAMALVALTRELLQDRNALVVALVVAGAVVFAPYGYLVGMVLGTILASILRR
jgi:MFS superfamily sulfate permease-like transporter